MTQYLVRDIKIIELMSFTCFCEMFLACVKFRRLVRAVFDGFRKFVYHWNGNAIRRVSSVTVSRFHRIHYTEFVSEIVFEIRNSRLGYVSLVST